MTDEYVENVENETDTSDDDYDEDIENDEDDDQEPESADDDDAEGDDDGEDDEGDYADDDGESAGKGKLAAEQQTADSGQDRQDNNSQLYDAQLAKDKAGEDLLKNKILQVAEYYGFTEGSVEDRLDKMAAEAAGKSVEEYRKEQQEKQQAAENARIIEQLKAEEVMKKDLAELKTQYPELDLQDIRKMDNFQTFAKARVAGLTVVQAFAAANPSYGREAATKAARQAALNKSHLRSTTSRDAGDFGISSKEMRTLRDTLPDASDKELREIFKKIKSK